MSLLKIQRLGQTSHLVSTEQGKVAWPGTAHQSKAPDSIIRHSVAQHSIAPHSIAQHSVAQHSIAWHSMAPHRTAQHKADAQMCMPSAGNLEHVGNLAAF